MKEWFEIFKCGTHTSMSGEKVTIDEAKLDSMAEKYNEGEHEAPLVIGHPKSNAPAYGWCDKLKRVGDRLLALPKQVNSKFAECVKQGAYKKRSLSMYPDGTLRHIGFLGAQPPAIKGLADISFEESGEPITYLFQEQEADMPSVEELQVQLREEQKAKEAAEARAEAAETKNSEMTKDFAEKEAASKHALLKAEIASFIKKGVDDGKLLPAWKERGLAEFMEDLESSETVLEFSEGDNKTPGEWFKEFLLSFSEHPLFKEMVVKKEDDQSSQEFTEAEAEAKEMASFVS